MRGCSSLAVVAILLGAVTASGCGGSVPSSAITFTGTPGTPVPATLRSGLFRVPAGFGPGISSTLIVDTGAPVLVVAREIVDQLFAAGAPADKLASLETLGLAFQDVPFVASDAYKPSTGDAAGVIGCSLLSLFAVSFDYRASTIILNGTAPDGELGPELSASFKLEGGVPAEQNGQFELPPSRIVVEASVEATPRQLLLDTGSTGIALARRIFEPLAADGRSELLVAIESSAGTTTAGVARLRSVVYRGESVERPTATGGAAIDRLLDRLSSELGRPLEGVLGASFLREFQLLVDYPASRLVLRRYANRSHIRDEFVRVGIDTGFDSARQVLLTLGVVPGSDAERQGLHAGDRVAAIDGVAVSALGFDAASEALTGLPGQARNLELGCDGCPGLRATRQVALDDLLPNP